MNIAIVDDSTADRLRLLTDIKNYAQKNAVLVSVTEYSSCSDFMDNAQLPLVDAVFLDIYVGEQSGMDLARQMRSLHSSCQIVFVTTSPAFAVESYEVNAFYYIVKPFSYSDIERVMNMLDKKLHKSSRYIKIKEGREWCKVLISDILYVDYYNHYVQIHTENAIISTYMKFLEIEEKLLAYSEFLVCYRCIIVNMDKIKKVDDLFFLMNTGEYVPINRKRVKELKATYVDYIFGVIDENG